MMNDAIKATPKAVAADVQNAVEQNIPDSSRIQDLARQLLQRHVLLGLKPVVSSEEIVEAHFRCVITNHLTERHNLKPAAIPSCINSSHQAVRRVCGTPAHDHARIEDDAWRGGWFAMQLRTPEVNIKTGRSARRADLYLGTSAGVVSIEFKYVGTDGVRDVGDCAAQFGRHAAHHAEAILVLYSGTPLPNRVVQQLEPGSGANVRVVNMVGPQVPVVRQAT